MRLKGTLVLCAIALGGLTLAVAGCGGDETTTVTVSTSAETTEASTTESMETTTEMTETETTEMTGTETEASGTDTNALGFLSSENCQEYLQFVSSYANALSGTGDTDMEEAAQALQEVADQAPDEVKDDFQTLAEFYAKLADAYEGVDLSSGQVPSADVIAKLQQLSSELDMAKVGAAGTNISTWLTQNCTPTG